MPMVAKSSLSTSNQTHASYLLRSDDLDPQLRPLRLSLFLRHPRPWRSHHLHPSRERRLLLHNYYTDRNHLTDPDPHLWFLPGFESLTSSFLIDFGIRRLNHAVGNVEDLKSAVSYIKGFTGFHEFPEFTVRTSGRAKVNSTLSSWRTTRRWCYFR
ncbi:hypothetical protein ACFX19_034637 [Malus domestica]